MKLVFRLRAGFAARCLPLFLFSCVALSTAMAQDKEQDALTKAIDSTATQWSFQFAYQKMFDYKDDTLSNGMTRPAGADNYWQLRVVAPFVFNSFTLLPRLTLRHYEAPNGDDGWGNTELFGLIIPKSWDWGSGRTGWVSLRL